jgi:glycosyltransferase involved in cell wall biosynthesis
MSAHKMARSGRKLRVAVIYHIWPHYRLPVMQAMDESERVEYTFMSSGEPFQGILHADMGKVRRFVRTPYAYHGRVMWQPGAIEAVRRGGFDVVILLADPNFASTWVAAALARLKRIPVLFWGHGWLKRESRKKAMMRMAYFRLANRFLIYAERGKRLGAAAGFPEDRIDVVYNSLDTRKAETVVEQIEQGELASAQPQDFFAHPERPLVICTARLTDKCRFDLLIEAAALLAKRGLPINVLLVGDGPVRGALERLVKDLGVDTHFFGACYDEETTGQLIYHADLTVSPGKIGLTAMHSLMYGTPAITHSDFDEQMPEVEAIEEGVTGTFFERGNAESLADAIGGWLSAAPPRDVVRRNAQAVIAAKWNPQVQARIIEGAVLGVIGNA